MHMFTSSTDPSSPLLSLEKNTVLLEYSRALSTKPNKRKRVAAADDVGVEERIAKAEEKSSRLVDTLLCRRECRWKKVRDFRPCALASETVMQELILDDSFFLQSAMQSPVRQEEAPVVVHKEDRRVNLEKTCSGSILIKELCGKRMKIQYE